MAKDPSKKKKKPPKGVAQLPEWWMETTPHDTIYPDGEPGTLDTALGHKSEWEKENEAKYIVGENGLLLDKKTGDPIDTGEGSGFTRDEKTGEWMKDGKRMFGRQIKSSVVSPTYGHKDMNWKQPDWMKVSSCSFPFRTELMSEKKLRIETIFQRGY